MIDHDGFDLELRALLDELAPPTFPDYLDDLRSELSIISQRRRWTVPAWWGRLPAPGLQIAWWPVAAVLGLLLLLALLAVVIGSKPRVPPPFGPARNGLLVFDDGARILAFDPTSGASRPLTSGGGTDTRASVSPDGRRVAYLHTDAGGDHVFVIDIDGSRPTDLLALDGPAQLKLEPAEWSPDSRRFAITVLTGTGSDFHAEIRILDAEGGLQQTLAVPGVIGMEAPAWSPDGRRLAFLGQTGPDVRAYLHVIDLDTSVVTRLSARPSSPDTGFWFAMRWSPDGRSIASSYGGATSALMRDVYLLASDGSSATRIASTDADEAQPAWSPDGTRLALWRSVRAATWRPLVVDLATRGERVLRVDSSSADDLAWSPDGRSLTLARCVGSGSCDLLLVDADGGLPPTLVARVVPTSPSDSSDRAYWSFQRLAP